MSIPAQPLGEVSEGGALGDRLTSLAALVTQLQTRLEVLEAIHDLPTSPAAQGAPGSAGQVAPEENLQVPPLSQILGLLGRACLIMGGAYFIRAFTDSGQLPRLPVALLGLSYAALWGAQGRRAARNLDATVYTLVAAMIAFPLLWETTTTFGVFSAVTAAFIYTAVTCLLVAAAWQRSLHVATWCITLAAMGSGLALAAATHALELFSLVFLGLGGGSLWLTYGRRWHGLRWPVALSANGLIALLTIFITWPGGPPEAYRTLSAGRGMALCLGLMGVYLGSFAGRMVQRYRPVNTFEIVQTIAVLILGFGGAVRIASASHSGLGALGISILVAGAACYAVAFYFVEDRSEVQANFLFFTSLALVFVLSGGFILFSWGLLSGALATLGLVLVLTGLRFGRTTLLFHATAYLTAAALTSGTLDQALQAFLGAGTAPLPYPGVAGIFTMAALLAAHSLLIRRRGPTAMPWRLRMPSLVCGTLALLGFGGSTIWIASRALGAGAPDLGFLAAIRTGVLAISAVGLAYLGRRIPASECVWLVYPLLALGALKFLFEDLSAGRPLTLFIAFTLYGIALIAAPRLLRAEPPLATP